jgi:hypothetical protein
MANAKPATASRWLHHITKGGSIHTLRFSHVNFLEMRRIFRKLAKQTWPLYRASKYAEAEVLNQAAYAKIEKLRYKE